MQFKIVEIIADTELATDLHAVLNIGLIPNERERGVPSALVPQIIGLS